MNKIANKDGKQRLNEGRTGKGIAPNKAIPPKPNVTPSPQKPQKK